MRGQEMLRFKVNIFECVEPHDPDENYSAG
jgi:hypothetical protein